MVNEARKPVLLVIRDGWGINEDPALQPYNAIVQAETPCSDELTKAWPTTRLAACGQDVGLPPGIMGNSEVGHQNIGAGRIVDQELVRIDKGFAGEGMLENPALKGAFGRVKETGGNLHLMGIVSDAGVHGMLEHLYSLLRLARTAGVERVFIHAITDGRDTPPTSGLGYIRQVETQCREIGLGEIASVCGRFWMMDRDKRWERVERGYNLLMGVEGEKAASAEAAVQHYYDHPMDQNRKGDEFVAPTWVVNAVGEPLATVSDGDAFIFYNYRGDRPREISYAFLRDDFDGFERKVRPDFFYATMTDYEKGLCPNVLFPKPPKMVNILGQVVADRGIPQFRSAETEKFPHVTFFFNDYREEPFPGEERGLVPSPKVSTYDQQPEMSAAGVTEVAEAAIRSGTFGLVVVNFANPDMVGHTGVLDAARQACEVTDACVATLLRAIDAMDGRAVITADHGNSDQMFVPETNSPHTAHTLNPVELVLYGRGLQNRSLRQEDTRLADIAPTLLELMELEIPDEMTGKSLLLS